MIDDKELGEMGGVLFLAVFVVFLIMIALAFEIDFVRRMITEAQYKRTAAVVGLASLRTFRANAMAGEVSVSERQRIGRRAALEESRRVAALPGVASVFRPVSSLDFKIIPTEEVQGSVPSDAEGLISFGYWHFEPPAAGCSNSRQTKCPCPESQWLGPCFQPLRPNAKELPTAVQIELFTPEEKPLPMIFARFFGHQGSSIRVRAAVSLLSDAGILSTPRIVENVALPKRESLPEQESDSAEAEQADPSPLPTPALSPSPVPQITSTLKTPTPEETKRPCTARVLRYDKPGEYEIHIPHGCLIVKANVWGAGGASGSNTNKEPDSDGGGGGFVYGVIKLKQTDSLKLTVGSGGKSPCPQAYRQPAGFGGPGAALRGGSAGGGYSAIERNQTLELLAAGGGAGGLDNTSARCPGSRRGGAGGGDTGEHGEAPQCFGKPAKGGTQTEGGAGEGNDRDLEGKKLLGGTGGGGGGYYGGGGAVPEHGGAAGGASFIAKQVTDGRTAEGKRRIPGGTKEPDYRAPAAIGGLAVEKCKNRLSHGQPGLIVLRWE